MGEVLALRPAAHQKMLTCSPSAEGPLGRAAEFPSASCTCPPPPLLTRASRPGSTGGCGNGHPPESPPTPPLHPRAYLQRSPMTPVGWARPPPLTAAFKSRTRAQQSWGGLQREGRALTVLPSEASRASCGLCGVCRAPASLLTGRDPCANAHLPAASRNPNDRVLGPLTCWWPGTTPSSLSTPISTAPLPASLPSTKHPPFWKNRTLLSSPPFL